MRYKSNRLQYVFIVAIFTLCTVGVMAGGTPDDDANELIEKLEYTVENSKADICILSYNTEFKSLLIDRLVKEYTDRGITVTVDDVVRGSTYRAETFDVVIVLGGVQGFRTLREATRYIKDNDYSEKIVYVFAYTLTKFPYGGMNRRKVDAITTASKADSDEVLLDTTRKVISRVDKILAK